MSRYNDQHYDCRRWTNAKLMREARRLANFQGFAMSMIARAPETIVTGEQATDFIVNETKLFRKSWLNPILDEIERRFVKGKKND